MREVSVYFPERGIRDITQQLRTIGLITAKKKSTKVSCSNMARCLVCVLPLSLFLPPPPSLSLSLSFSIERRHGDGGSGSDSGGESRRMYKSRSVISSESDSDEEPSSADKKKTHPSKDTKKGIHVYFYV